LGVDDPVTKEAVGSSNTYFQLLAKEVCGILLETLKVVYLLFQLIVDFRNVEA
jgi:hypothetical protein